MSVVDETVLLNVKIVAKGNKYEVVFRYIFGNKETI